MQDLLNQLLSEGDFVILPVKGNFQLHVGKIIGFDTNKVRVIFKSELLKDPITALVFPEAVVKIDKMLITSEMHEAFDG